NAFKVNNERCTASRLRPVYEQRADQARQNDCVSCKAARQSSVVGGGKCDGPCVSTNGTHSPSATSNSATVAKFLPRSATGERSTTRLGPAMALRPDPSSSRVTHGTVTP